MRSTNAEVRRLIDRAPDRTFLTTEDVADRVEGSRHAVHNALDREAAAGYLVQVRRGLFWKPEGRRRQPYGFDVAAEVVRLAGLSDGAGPTGDAARWLLGLGELPTVWVETVLGRAPRPLTGVRFVGRRGEHRRGLSRHEVGALELLRDGPLPALPRPWVVRLPVVAEAALSEWSLEVRERGRRLLEAGET